MYEDVFIVIWVEHERCKKFKQPINCTLERHSIVLPIQFLT
jgi:hypothetical protein